MSIREVPLNSILTIEGVALMLRRSVKTTRNKLREEGAPKPLEHFLPAIRWDREEVQRWIESRK